MTRKKTTGAMILMKNIETESEENYVVKMDGGNNLQKNIAYLGMGPIPNPQRNY